MMLFILFSHKKETNGHCNICNFMKTGQTLDKTAPEEHYSLSSIEDKCKLTVMSCFYNVLHH